MHLGTQNLDHATSATSNYSQPGVAAPSSVLTQQDFLARVDFAKSEIRTLSSNIQEIASLHQRALSSPDNNSSAQLENLVSQTQLKNTQIRDQIKYLELDAVKTQDGTKSTKARQAKQLKGEFEKSLKEYQQEEVAYRQRYRDQIARQYRIVNPEASEAEVQEASELDWGSEGVFQTAVSISWLSSSTFTDMSYSSRATDQARLHLYSVRFVLVIMSFNASRLLSQNWQLCSQIWHRLLKHRTQL